MSRYRVHLLVTIAVETDEDSDALPAALGYFQEAMDWAAEHYEGSTIKAVEWNQGTLELLKESEL